jgi:sec-independent protein translocase protein TatA
MILIVFVALLLFGGEKLPEIARGLGKGIRDFKDASDGVKREINNQINSYEEKREEQKRIEEITKPEEKAGENTENENSAGRFTPVENTVPVNDNYFNTDHSAAETHNSGHDTTVENHDAAHHATTNEMHTGTTTESLHGVGHEQVSSGHTENS